MIITKVSMVVKFPEIGERELTISRPTQMDIDNAPPWAKAAVTNIKMEVSPKRDAEDGPMFFAAEEDGRLSPEFALQATRMLIPSTAGEIENKHIEEIQSAVMALVELQPEGE